MSGRGALARSFGKNFHGDLFKLRVEPRVSSLCRKAIELGQLLCTADRLEKLVNNLRGGGGRLGSPRDNFNFIGIFRRGITVLLSQTGRDLGVLDAAMAGVAGHQAGVPEVGPI